MKGQIEYQVSDDQIEEAIKNVENYNDDTMDTITVDWNIDAMEIVERRSYSVCMYIE